MTRRFIVVFTALLILISVWRAEISAIGGDFLRYHRAGRLVATGRAEKLYDVKLLRSQGVYAKERAEELAAHANDPSAAEDFPEMEFKYDPAFAVLMAPLGALDPRTAWVIWGGWNALMIALTFIAAWSLTRLPWRWALLGFAVLGHKASTNLNLGQINPTPICAMTVSLWLATRGSTVAAGIAAAFGTAVKYLPATAATYLGIRAMWKGLVAFCVATVFFFWGLPALVLSPARATALFWEHKEVRAKFFTTATPQDLPGNSIKSFVYRVFGGVHYQSGKGATRADLDISIAHLPPDFLKWTVIALDAVLVAVVLFAAFPRRRDDESGAAVRTLRTAVTTAMIVALIPLVSPEARAPHFLYLALPFCALLAGTLHAWQTALPCRRMLVALTVVSAVLLHTDSGGIFGTAADTMSAWCSLGFANALILVGLFIVLRETRRAPAMRTPGTGLPV